MKRIILLIILSLLLIVLCILGIKKNNIINLTNLTYNNKDIKKYIDYDTFIKDYKDNKTPNVYITNFIFDGENHIDIKSSILNINRINNIHLEGNFIGGVFINSNNVNDLNIYLNNINIDTNINKIPGLYIYGKSGKATINLGLATSNYIKGGHLKKTDYSGNMFLNLDGVYKAGGTISSDIDITFKGDGILNIISSKEGIESKGSINFLDGDYIIESKEDGINAYKDIFIDLESLKINVSDEGDAIDSNSSLTINKGYILAKSKGDDAGLDSEDTYINGGTIISLGNAYDKINENSKQEFSLFELNSNKIILKDNNDVILNMDLDTEYKYLIYSDSIKRTLTLVN